MKVGDLVRFKAELFDESSVNGSNFLHSTEETWIGIVLRKNVDVFGDGAMGVEVMWQNSSNEPSVVYEWEVEEVLDKSQEVC